MLGQSVYSLLGAKRTPRLGPGPLYTALTDIAISSDQGLYTG
jgi:hypothetical protein